MFYTPKHCCECGEKIDRSDSNLLGLGRFCEVCQSEFKIYDWFPFLVLGFGAFLAVFGIGSLLTKSNAPATVSTTPAVLIASNRNQGVQNSQVPANSNVQLPTSNRAVENEANGVGSETNKPLQNAELSQKNGAQSKRAEAENRQNPSDEPIYFCGAQTKKGTPCSRRVKGGGRCWQHIGQPAMLPREKLIVRQ